MAVYVASSRAPRWTESAPMVVFRNPGAVEGTAVDVTSGFWTSPAVAISEARRPVVSPFGVDSSRIFPGRGE